MILQTLVHLLSSFASLFSFGLFPYFLGFLMGFLATDHRKAVTQLVLAGQPWCPRFWTGWHYFLRKAHWEVTLVAQHWVNLIAQTLATLRGTTTPVTVFLIGDDTHCQKWGHHFFGIGRYFNYRFKPDRNQAPYLNAHVWVTLALAIPGTLLPTPLAWVGPWLFLPLLARLYVKQADCAGLDHPFQKKEELLVGMVQALTFPLWWTVVLVGDRFYAKRQLFRDLYGAPTPRVHLLVRLKKNQAIYEPAPPRTGKPGRPAQKGQRLWLPDLVTTAIFQPLEVVLYGRRQTVQVASQGVYLRLAKGLVQLVLVKRAATETPWFLACTDLSLEVTTIVEGYGGRYQTETGYQDGKALVGLDEYMVRGRLGLERFVHLALWSITLLRLLPLWAPEACQTAVQEFQTQWAPWRRGERCTLGMLREAVQIAVQRAEFRRGCSMRSIPEENPPLAAAS